jgi:hypothetical protein
MREPIKVQKDIIKSEGYLSVCEREAETGQPVLLLTFFLS